MTTEINRDLNADLAICSAATSGPWSDTEGNLDINAIIAKGHGCPVCGDYGPERAEDATFIIEARTGWPIAIERAINAEAEVERLNNGIVRLRDQLICDLDAVTSGDTDVLSAAYENFLTATLRRIDEHTGGDGE